MEVKAATRVVTDKYLFGRLRAIGMLEGISYLLLLGVAMPLKYMAGKPEAVAVVGMAHGVLFVLYCFALLYAWNERGWRFGRVFVIFCAALLPFGPFVIDKGLKEEDEDLPSENLKA